LENAAKPTEVPKPAGIVGDIMTGIEEGAEKFKESFGGFAEDSGLNDAMDDFSANMQTELAETGDGDTSIGGFSGGVNPLEMLGGIALKNDKELVKEQKIANAYLKRISENVGKPAVMS
jgi:hypothetical protein